MNVGCESSPASLPRFRADSACGVPRMNLDRRDSAAGQFGAPTDPRPQPAIHNSPRDRSERSRGTYKPQGAARKHRYKLMPRNRSEPDEMPRQVTVSNGFIAESSARKPRRHSRPRRTHRTAREDDQLHPSQGRHSPTTPARSTTTGDRGSTRRLDVDTAICITQSDHATTFGTPMPRFVASTCNDTSHSRPGICKFPVVFRS